MQDLDVIPKPELQLSMNYLCNSLVLFLENFDANHIQIAFYDTPYDSKIL